MIISFDQNADFYMDIAEGARESGDLRKALRYCGDAVSRDPSPYNLTTLAMLYQDMNRHEYAIEECFSIIDGTKLDDEELSDIYLLLSNSLGRLGHFMQSWYYLSKRTDFDADIEDEEDVKDIFEDLYSKIEENTKGAKLCFSDEIREKQYVKCYRESVNHFVMGDYSGALNCAKPITPDAACYKDTLMLMSKCHVYNSDIDNAKTCWLEVLKLNPEEGAAINGLAFFNLEDKYTRKLIKEFRSDNEEDIKYVISAASLKNMYDIADNLSDRLLTKDAYNPKYHFIKGAVRFNMGDKAGAENIYKDILTVFSNKFPMEYMLNSFKRHRHLSILFEHIPPEIAKRIATSISKEIKAYGFKTAFMSSLAFRQGVQYLLEKNLDAGQCIEVLKELGQWTNSAVIGLLKTVLLKPDVHFEVRRRILVILLHALRKGRIRMVNENIMTGLSLKTPPSYEDYPRELAISYCNAFAFLATVGIPFERAISKLVEKIYLKKLEFASISVLSAAISYYCIADQNVFTVDNIAGIFDTDASMITEAVSDIQEALDDQT